MVAMTRVRTILIAGLATCNISFIAAAQSNAPATSVDLQPVTIQPANIQPVDMRVQDIGILDQSLRVVPQGLNVPTDFSQVYQLGGAGGQYARIQGGLYAVFPQSSYVFTQAGDVPVIPAGTVFYIGPPPEEALGTASQSQQQPPPGSELVRWNTRVGALPTQTNRHIEDGVTIEQARDELSEQQRIAALNHARNNAIATGRVYRNPAREQPRAAPFEIIERNETSEPAPEITDDDNYRANRLHELMQRAAQAETQREASKSK